MRFSSLFDSYRTHRTKRAPGRSRRRKAPSKRRLTVESLETRQLLASIQGVVFEDLNGDGVLSGEPPLAGATVWLDTDQDGFGDDSVVTDATGAYEFTGLAAGDYEVTQTPPAGWMQTTPGGVGGTFGQVLGSFPVADTSSLQYTGLDWFDGVLYTVQEGQSGVADNMLYRLDPLTGVQQGSAIPVPGEIGEIAFDGVNFWGADWPKDRLYQFDAAGQELRNLTVTYQGAGVDVNSVEWDGDSLRILDSGNRRIYDLDPIGLPASGSVAVTSFITTPNENVGGLAYDGEDLWTNGRDSDLVFELDASTGAIKRAIEAPRSFSYGLAVHGGTLWVEDKGNQEPPGAETTIYRIDVRPNGDSHRITLAAGETASGVDFGHFQFGSASGRVFNDLNENGIDDGELGLEGWRVFDDLDGDHQFDVWEPHTISDAVGQWTLDRLGPGAHTIIESLREPGWTAPATTEYFVNVASSGAVEAGLNFGHLQTGLAPVGAELAVTTDTSWKIRFMSPTPAAMDDQGNLTVVWRSQEAPSELGWHVYARFYDNTGAPLDVPTQVSVSAYVDGANDVKVARAATTGVSAITWRNLDGRVLVRLYDAGGAPLTGEIEADADARWVTGVAMDDDGNFVVLTTREIGRFNDPVIYAQRFDSNGQKTGKAIKVSGQVSGFGIASVAMDADGDFVVVWTNDGIMFQRFDSSGRKVGGATQLSPTGGSSRVSMDDAGNFFVRWWDNGDENKVRVVNADGSFHTPVLTVGAGYEFQSIAAQAGGGFVLVGGIKENINSAGVWGPLDGVYLQRFSQDGDPVDPTPVQVNTTIYNGQRMPGVAASNNGDLTVVWSNNRVDRGSGVLAQRYTSPAPAPPAPSFSIDDVTMAEGDSGTTSFTFTVTRSGDLSPAVSVDFATADGTATTAENDYIPISGMLNFAADETTKMITVAVNGDTLDEPEELFYVNLSNASAGTVIADDQGVGTIQNDDSATPAVYVSDISFAHRTRGNKDDLRVFATILQDDGSNTPAAGAAVTIELRNSNGVLIGTDTGTTNSGGVFTSNWFRDLDNGETYTADVIDVSFGAAVWTLSIGEDDGDDDGFFPDESFMIP